MEPNLARALEEIQCRKLTNCVSGKRHNNSRESAYSADQPRLWGAHHSEWVWHISQSERSHLEGNRRRSIQWLHTRYGVPRSKESRRAKVLRPVIPIYWRGCGANQRRPLSDLHGSVRAVRRWWQLISAEAWLPSRGNFCLEFECHR